jgi:hypothetical protein
MAKGSQNRLALLGKSALVRDDSGPFRVYRDDSGSVFHSVTHILKETAPEWQQQALERWLARPTAAEDRDMAATRGTLAHNHAEYLLKTGSKLARQTANKRNSWKTSADGLERCPGSITRWAIERAIQGAPRVPWSASGYARGLRGWIADNCTAIHAVEFSIHHPAGMAGTCDALLDINGKGPFIVDWKTSVRERSEDMLTNYIDQLGAYSLGLKSLTDIQPIGGLVVVARRTGAPQVRELSGLELMGAEFRFLERVGRYFNPTDQP